MRGVNPETITGTLSWYKILPLDGFNLVRAKRNPHMRRKKVCQNSWNRHTDRTCEDLSWNHRTSAPLRSETNGIAERAVRRAKEGTSAVLQKSGLDERWWGLTLWHVIAILETSKTSWPTGRHHMKDDLENQSKGQ